MSLFELSKTVDGNILDFKLELFNLNPDLEMKWKSYYLNNPSLVTSYYGGTKSEKVVKEIENGARDTANGFNHMLNIIHHGNPETDEEYRAPLSNLVYGVAYVVLSGQPHTTENEMHNNILMSVGVFTSKSAKFYVMVGISIGFGSSIKIPGLSKFLSGFVALAMNSDETIPILGEPKPSFITRPLEKMSKLFKEFKTENQFNLPYRHNLLLPTINSENYNKLKRGVTYKKKEREIAAKEWLLLCKLGKSCKSIECKNLKCIGDYDFFKQFVVDAFSPRWPFSGKRADTLMKNFTDYTVKQLKRSGSKKTRRNSKSV